MILIGVCGMISSGKSTICNILHEHRWAFFECDKEAKKYAPPMANVNIFQQKDVYDDLCKNVWKKVKNEVIAWKKGSTCTFGVVESAVLFESKINQICDITVEIVANASIRQNRSTLAPDDFTARNALQFTPHPVDITFTNDGKTPIETLAHQLIEQCQSMLSGPTSAE